MRFEEDLYSSIPPSFKRDLKPFIASDTSVSWCFLAGLLFNFLLKRKFAAIRIKNLDYLQKRNPDKPNIIYAPHICWWDGILAYFLCRKVFKLDLIAMAEELYRYPLLRKLGIFSVDKKSPKNILTSLNFAVKNLDSPQKALFIYPQGIIRPQDYMPVNFNPGLTYIASQLDGVNLIPLSIRYVFLRNTSPEVLVEVNEPIFLEKVEDRDETTSQLRDHFENILENQRKEVISGKLKNYEIVLGKNYNIRRKIENRLKNTKAF